MKTGVKSNKEVIIKILNVFFSILIVFIFGLFIFEGYFKPADYSFVEDKIFDWGEEWAVITDEGTKETINLPAKLDVNEGETVTITKDLPDTIKKYNCLMYESMHQDVKVSVGGVNRYTYSDNGSRLFGNSSPDAIILIPLYSSDQGYEITVNITANSFYSGNIGSFYLGNEKSILLMLIKNNIFWVVLCIALAVMAIVCLACYCVYRNSMEEGRAFGYLFWMALLSGLWSFSNLEIRQMFVGNIRFHDNLGSLSMMILPIYVLGLSNWVSRGEHSKPYTMGLLASILNFVFQSILYILNVFDFFQMHAVTDILICVILITIEITLSSDVKKKNRSAHFSVIGVSTLLIASVVDIICSASGKTNNAVKIYIFSFIVYVSVNLFHLILSINRKEQLRKDAESASQAKSQFLAVMSHEIRTPINAVLGMNEMISRESNEKVIQEYSATISDAGKSLLALVNDILDFSKIEAGKMDIVCTEYSLKTVLRDLVSMVKGRIENKNLKLELNIDENIPSKLFGDAVRIKQVLINLLTNAAKYTDNGTITFSVDKREITEDRVSLYFSVKDTGSGIRQKDIDLLMTSSFIRVDEVKNSNIEGTGLGLAITRQLLELMDSALEIDSVYGEGSDFHFVLTQKVIDESPMGHISARRNTQKKFTPNFTIPAVRILAVDDNKVNLMVLQNLLKAYECKLFTCTSGEKCVEMCKEQKFDLIFMDHMMPGMDGIDTLKALREGEGLIDPSVKVIALTANAVSGAAQLYRESGFDGYITKPIDFVELEKNIESSLSPELIVK